MEENTPLPESVKPETVPELTSQVVESGKAPDEAAITEADTQVSEPATDTGKSDAKPETRRDKRIQQLIEERQNAEREAAHWRQRAEALPPKPAGNEVDHPDDASWRKAIVQESIQEAQRAAAESTAEEAARRAFQARGQAFEARVTDFRERAPDFDQVARNPNLPITHVMGEAITESDCGPQVAYWLGKNQSEAARIASLPPVRQVAEIGRLEARLTAAPLTKKTTQAPPPPRTLAGTPSPSAPNLDDMDYETYVKTRKAKR